MSPRLRRPALALLALAPLAAAASPAAAQTRQPDQARAETLAARLDDMSARLALSDEQKTAVETVLRDSFARRTAVLRAAGANGRQRPRDLRRLRAEMDQIREDTRSRLAPILTPAQLAEYDLIQAELREQARERFRQRGRW